MNSFTFVLVVLSAAAGALAFPQTDVDDLFQPKRRNVDCDGNPSTLVENCIGRLAFLEHMSSGMPLEKVDTPEELDTVCRALENVTDCVEQVHRVCHKEEDMMTAIVYETMAGVAGHICSPYGRHVVLNQSACWENEDLVEDIDNCAVQQQHGDICRMLNDLKTCIVEATRGQCGDMAASFMGELLYYALTPMASRLSMIMPGAAECHIRMRMIRSLLNALPKTRRR